MAEPAPALIRRGLERHRAGQLDAAEALYRQALAAAPATLEGWRLLGVLQQQRGAFEASLATIGRALAIRREAPDLSNLANALNTLGRSQAAADACVEAIALDPALAAAHCNLGVALRALDRPGEAADSFRAAATLQPAYADAHANLGVALSELGRLPEAEAALTEALRLAPQAAEPWFNLANLHLRQLRFDSARTGFERAIALRPAYPDAHANLAAVYKAQGEPEHALAHFAEAARLAPSDIKVVHNYALALAERRRFAEAAPVYEQAIGLESGHPNLHTNLGSALQEQARDRFDAAAVALLDRAMLCHLTALTLDPDHFVARSNLGLALLAKGQFAEAATAFEVAAALRPDSAETHSNHAQALGDLGRIEAATESVLRAIALKPDLAEAHSTHGNLLIARHRLAEAEAAYREALRLQPRMGGGWCNLGVALFRQGRRAEAAEAYARALELSPDMPDAHWNTALVLLQAGAYAQGFRAYEWRLKRAARARQDAHFALPVWDGRPLDGEAVLVHAEQGFGDAILCARFLPRLAARGARVVLQARAPLKRLLERAEGVSRFVTEGDPAPPTAWRLPMFSLPAHLVQGVNDLRAPAAYLAPPDEASSAWAARITELGCEGPRVGLVWSGNVASEVEQGRSIPLAAFAPLAEVAGVRLISLQKADGLDQLAAAPFAVSSLGADYDRGDFADTASAMLALDLVVSCDTASAHLAGALGVPVWLAVNAVADWRWGEAGETTPWYRSMRIFRQPVRGDWDAVVARMAEALRAGL